MITDIKIPINTKRVALFILIQLILNAGISVNTYALSKQNKQYRDSLLNLPLFKEDAVLKMELKTNLTNLLKDVAVKRSYHQAIIKVFDEFGKSKELEVKVKTRGNFRRRRQNCNFPPLRFKISADQSQNSVFQGQSKLKYVSHCQSNIEGYEQHTVEEYLLYRMYNLITDYSYRVRLAQTSFVDSQSNDTLIKFGFFLEDKDDVAHRNGMLIMNYKNIGQSEVIRDNIVMLSLFQLMIGNADWDVKRLHNIDLMAVSENSLPVAVPYDFDWSGIINHSYFTLSPQISANAKYKRLYKGMRWSADEFSAAFANFKELKSSFLELIINCEYLTDENRNKLIAYVEKFYQLIDSKKDVRMIIQKNSEKIRDNR